MKNNPQVYSSRESPDSSQLHWFNPNVFCSPHWTFDSVEARQVSALGESITIICSRGPSVVSICSQCNHPLKLCTLQPCVQWSPGPSATLPVIGRRLRCVSLQLLLCFCTVSRGQHLEKQTGCPARGAFSLGWSAAGREYGSQLTAWQSVGLFWE
jgi:hypothetical protein